MVAANAGVAPADGAQAQVKPGLIAQALRLWQVSLYLLVYLVLVGLYIFCVLHNSREMTVANWQAAYTKGDSAATVGIRVQKQYDFVVPKGPAVSLLSGEKITTALARMMSQTILAEEFPYETLRLYRTGWFWNLDWAEIFKIYNLLGLFGALYLGLRKPVAQMLTVSGGQVASALEEARAAKAEAESLKQRYEEMHVALEAEKEQFAKTLIEEETLERERIMQMAQHEAAGIIESVKQSIDAEVQDAARRLRKEVVKQALSLARKQVTADTSGEEHETLFTDFIGDLERLAKND